MLLVLIGLCIEWAVYHRDALTRLRRGLGARFRRNAPDGSCLMGISFDAPLALLLLIPALLLTIGLHVGARRRMGSGRRRAALIVRSLLLAALVFALAGFQLVLPVDRLATVFVVDLSDSVGNAGREDALAFLRETLDGTPRRRRRRDRRVRQGGAGRAAAGRTRPRSTGLPLRPSARRPTSAPRCASRRRYSPTMRRSGSSFSPMATTRPATASPRRPWRPRAASGSRPDGSGSATSTRSSSSA